MNPNTKLMKVLKAIYHSRDKKITPKEISTKTGIPLRDINAYTTRLLAHVHKEKINGRPYYWIKPYAIDYIRRIINKADQENEEKSKIY